jgi:hypothetical protein
MLYIQSIAADFGRGLIYGLTFPGEAFFVFDLNTNQSKIWAMSAIHCSSRSRTIRSWTPRAGSGAPTPKRERGTKC